MLNWAWDENGVLFSYPEGMNLVFARKVRAIENQNEADITLGIEAYIETREEEDNEQN